MHISDFVITSSRLRNEKEQSDQETVAEGTDGNTFPYSSKLVNFITVLFSNIIFKRKTSYFSDFAVYP